MFLKKSAFFRLKPSEKIITGLSTAHTSKKLRGTSPGDQVVACVCLSCERLWLCVVRWLSHRRINVNICVSNSVIANNASVLPYPLANTDKKPPTATTCNTIRHVPGNQGEAVVGTAACVGCV